jgi:hypothetical protein
VERLDEIKQRMADASPGPWHVKTANFGDDWIVGIIKTGESGEDGKIYGVHTTNVRASQMFGDAKTDAEFIAHAPADLAWAIAEIERLKREMAEMEARHEDVVRDEIGWALMGEDL